MGARSGVALRGVQFFIRAVQFCCAALILAIFSYFLATMHSHDLPIDTWIRAVEGISGSAVLYTVLALLTLCCVAGNPFTSLMGIVLDVCFAGAFVYVAAANRAGASSCTGTVDTPFGTGDTATDKVPDGSGGSTVLPSLRQACQMQSACLAVAIVAIFFFLFSVLAELGLIRHRRKERRFGPSPANGYTSGYGKRRGGLFGLFGRSERQNTGGSLNPNVLPEHTHPDDIRTSYATEQTRIGTANGITTAGVVDPKYDSLKYAGHDIGSSAPGTVAGHADAMPVVHYPPANYRYDDGVFENAESRF